MKAWGERSPTVPADNNRFRCEFLPLRRRVVGREGIELFNLKYSDETLVPEVALGIQRIVRFDPRDPSHVYLERKDKSPPAVRLRDRQLPALSLWEWNAFQRQRGEFSGHGDLERLAPASTVASLSALPSWSHSS